MSRDRFGKYRGVVTRNDDPKQLGRLEVRVPSVFGTRRAWAMPCTPYAGKKVGFFALPPKDSSVWVEFEAGDPDRPIWVGGFWEARSDLPGPATEAYKIFRTKGVTLTVNDTEKSGGVELLIDKTIAGVQVKLTVKSSGISLDIDGTKVEANGKAVDISTGSAKMSLATDSAAIEHGSATIELRQKSVSVNKTSLQVD